MLSFIRTDLNQLAAYTPNPGGKAAPPFDQLDANESPFDLPIELKEKLTTIYQQASKTNRYPDGSHSSLKGAITAYVNESANSQITPEQISLGNGSDELIRSLLIATCLQGEGSIFVAEPTFSMYAIIAETLGIPVIRGRRDEDNFAINLEQAEQLLQETTTPPVRVVFVVHPNSPTANALTPEEISWLKQLPEQVLVVIDEAYFEFSQTSLVQELPQHPNWVILRTFSKAFRLAAHRVGYAIAAPEVIEVLEKIRLPYNLPTFSQTAAAVALQHRDILLSSVSEILSQREILYQALFQDPQLQVWPSAANFIYFRPQTIPAAELAAALRQRGTLIRHTGGGLRITVGTQAENERTRQRLKNYLAS